MNIQQLRAQIAALQDATMDENKNFRTAYDEGKFDSLTAVDALLDSLQEEPESIWHDANQQPTMYRNGIGNTKYERKKTTMTLRELIDKATAIGRQVSSAEIPVIYNGVSDNLKSIELSQDNNGNYYIEIH